ncbi:aldehyde dehydrogenase [Streptomyces sp. NRRL B-1140]|uniref:aldehyde dehydrogenase n=1 Tax=Streptomyces sp. NRRL B-1140 TaxID=1415549 RepID=UPI0006AEB5C0|nr:aldehyde dehydrogenase [Streptomyces sp. NRRL B-1140]KOV97277.1 aldehyde dehydrogenase [Streptomyces sp. NRRL B-1140]
MSLMYKSLYIGGEWVAPSSSSTIDVISPNTEQAIGRVPEALEPDVDAAVAAARKAFDDPTGWANWAPERRADAIERFAAALDARADEMPIRVSSQNGMPIAISGRAENTMPQMMLRYYANMLRTGEIEFDSERDGVMGRIRVSRRPVGVVGAIVPWNVPQTIGAHKYGPALAMGCTLVIKPSPETVLDAMLFAEAAEEAQLPAGVINIVPGGPRTGAYLVEHPGVDKLSFTGSEKVGRWVAETAGRMLRPVTLELGGKAAAIVLDDADLTQDLEGFFMATMLNNGQSCYLGTRVLVPASRYGEVVDTITDFVRSLPVGDSLDPATRVGPLATAQQQKRVEDYIAKGKAEGARLTTGGGRPREQGWFVDPTVFADVDNRSTIGREEIFGPVLSIIKYTDDDDAVRVANDSPYGLGGTVWTPDVERGLSVASRIDTGAIGVNGFLADPAAPFGGTKASGMGRELGPEGLEAYQILKSTYLPR